MFKDIKVGDTVYFTGGYSKIATEDGIGIGTVDKVGNKYFYYKHGGRDVKVERETGADATDGTSTYRIYTYKHKQPILDERERNALVCIIRTAFPSYGMKEYTLDQLRRIKAILDEPKQS